MDRPLDSGLVRRRRLTRGAAAVGALVLIGVFFIGMRSWLRPTLSADRIRTAAAEAGRVEATIQASGTVVPRAEAVLSSPVSSRVLAIHRRVGDAVQPGDLILELDGGESRLQLDQTVSEIELKRNARRSRELAQRDRIAQLDADLELARIDLESRRAKLSRIERLAADDIVSGEDLLEAQLDIRRTEVEIRQKEAARGHEAETAAAELDTIASELRVLERRRVQQQATLDRASARATRAGVLTFVLDEVGTSVNQGDPLARVADLGTYRVDATLSDAYAARLREGQDVRVEVNDRRLPARLTTILPEIEDGSVQLQIELDEPAATGLRANLRVDVYIVTDLRDPAVTIAKGQAFNGSGLQQAFVIEDGVAVRRDIELGLSSYDRWEVVSGLQPGEVAIISDTRDIRHLSRVPIRD